MSATKGQARKTRKQARKRVKRKADRQRRTARKRAELGADAPKRWLSRFGLEEYLAAYGAVLILLFFLIVYCAGEAH